MTFEGMKSPKDEYEASATLHLVIDTCVWLDLGKDYRQRATISALEQMIDSGAINLLVPQQVTEEFHRNKTRVIDDASKSLGSTFRRVKDALNLLDSNDRSDATLAHLDDASRRLATLGSSVNDSIAKIETMLANAEAIATSDAVKVRAAERALAKQAPFHKGKNSMGDAVLIEQYAETARNLHGEDVIAFVTHNKHDFSESQGDERKPHAHLAQFFDGANSLYSINLAELLNAFAPSWMENLKSEFEGQQKARQHSEILKAESLLFRQVWYNRHWDTRLGIESGQIEVVEQADFKGPQHARNEIVDTVWAGALAAAKRTEDEVGLENLGPWDDFEWGILNGKLSALRWVMGDEWDMLDT